MTTHAELCAAIDKALVVREWYSPQGKEAQRLAHLDTLRAILDLHQPRSGDWAPVTCVECTASGADTTVYRSWPCRSVDIVADALTRMGVLRDAGS